MIKLLATTLCCFIAFAAPAMAENSQNNKMKECAAEYKDKKIPAHEYRGFMAKCLKTEEVKVPTQALNSQQQKMTHCNQEAKTKQLLGSPRESYMKECLSAK